MSQESLRKVIPEGFKPTVVPKVLKIILGGIPMNDQQSVTEDTARKSPIKNKIGSVFVPVKNIEESRNWYCRVLRLNEKDCNIINGHLCPLPMEGTGIILDTMPMWGGNQQGGAPHIETPAFMVMTEDLLKSLTYLEELGVEFVTGIEHDHWFVVKDPDGNKIMICRE
jgi:hypothetical protein